MDLVAFIFFKVEAFSFFYFLSDSRLEDIDFFFKLLCLDYLDSIYTGL